MDMLGRCIKCRLLLEVLDPVINVIWQLRLSHLIHQRTMSNDIKCISEVNKCTTAKVIGRVENSSVEKQFLHQIALQQIISCGYSLEGSIDAEFIPNACTLLIL